jgi:GNAT superfamily N-acetyltransferase
MEILDTFHRNCLPWLLTTPDAPPRPESYFADLLQREDASVFVAVAERVVGVAFGLMRSAPESPVFMQQRWAVLDALVVDPSWRRRGIGKRLTQSVESWATGLGAPWVEVNVYAINEEARQFYEALGYLPFSTKLRRPPPPGAG